MKLKFEKKHKFFLFSLVLGIGFYFLSLQTDSFWLLVLIIIVSLLGNYIVHIPNVNIKNVFYVNLLALELIAGVYLTFLFFPNLGVLFKTAAVISFVFLYYVIALANNVFLVVEERGEAIPLYRVSSTWSRILIVVVNIPFFAGIFKLSVNSFAQSFIVALVSTLMLLYIFWTLKFDTDSRHSTYIEKSVLALFTFYLIYVASIATAFFPAESFLRALFVSTVLMFSANFVYGHLKNTIRKSLLTEHFAISAVFFVLLVLFKS